VVNYFILLLSYNQLNKDIMKKLVYLLVVVFAVSLTTTSCATSKGCGYGKAQKFNKKQSKKAHRYHKRSSRGNGVFMNF
jgi:hypothetical protein